MGVVVDTVEEVLDMAEEQIEPPPNVGTHVDTQFILGLGKVGERVKILLDIERVLSSGEKAAIERLEQG